MHNEGLPDPGRLPDPNQSDLTPFTQYANNAHRARLMISKKGNVKVRTEPPGFFGRLRDLLRSSDRFTYLVIRNTVNQFHNITRRHASPEVNAAVQRLFDRLRPAMADAGEAEKVRLYNIPKSLAGKPRMLQDAEVQQSELKAFCELDFSPNAGLDFYRLIGNGALHIDGLEYPVTGEAYDPQYARACMMRMAELAGLNEVQVEQLGNQAASWENGEKARNAAVEINRVYPNLGRMINAISQSPFVKSAYVLMALLEEERPPKTPRDVHDHVTISRDNGRIRIQHDFVLESQENTNKKFDARVSLRTQDLSNWTATMRFNAKAQADIIPAETDRLNDLFVRHGFA